MRQSLRHRPIKHSADNGCHWVVLGSLAVGLASGAMQGSEQDDNNDAQYQKAVDTTNLDTQRQIWLAQQQRAYTLQDRAAKVADVREFEKYAPQYSDAPKSAPQSTTGLMNFDPTQVGSFSQLSNQPPST